MMFLVFYSIVLSVYALINFYIYSRGINALPAHTAIRSAFPWVFWMLVATYVAGRVLERYYLSEASYFLVWIGSMWLAAMLYFFLIVFLADVLRLINFILPFFPRHVDVSRFKYISLLTVVGGVVIAITAGHINTLFPVVRKQQIYIDKSANGMESLNVVLISDIHLGTLIGNRHLERIIKKIDKLKPDLILLAGDVLDEDLKPVLQQNTGELLRSFKAPLGVYAVMGNHEYIGGAEPAYNYLTQHGITIIRDSIIKVNESFYIIGRDDREKLRFTGIERKKLERLVSMANQQFPLIMMDHQPYNLLEKSRLGVDLQLSGHTHHGQLWPLNFVTGAIFEVSQGYQQINNMHVYVSNGIGTWGPPVRIGNRPEIVYLTISFKRTGEPALQAAVDH
jgi:uncharacterized protein